MLHILIVAAVLVVIVLLVLARHSLIAFLAGALFFVRDVFSDNGSASFSRIAAGVALLCYLRWVHAIVCKTGSIPDLTNGLILVGGLYGINKLSNVLTDFVQAYANSKTGAPPGGGTTVTASATIKP